MASYAVSELIERAQAAADMHDNFVTPTQWLRWFNVENRALALYIARSGYVLKEGREDLVGGTTINASGEASISEPLAVLGVYHLDSGRYRRLRHSDNMDGAGFIDTVTTGDARYFRVFQNTNGEVTLQFWPIPTSGIYLVFIIEIPVAVTLVTDTVNYPPGFEERIVLGMARRALAKEESDTREMQRQILETDKYIESVCWDRVMAGHQQIRNVDKVERGWTNTPQVPSREFWHWV